MRTSEGSPEGPYEGYIVDLVHAMSRLVPFDYQWRLKRTFGKRSRDGGALRWSGMIGEILTRDADVGAAAFTVDGKNERILDFSKPFLHSTFALLMKSPESEEGLEIFFLEDVLNQTTVDIGVIRRSRVEKILKKSRLSLYKDVWSRIRQDRSNIVPDMERGLRKIRQGNYALIVESTDAAYIASQPPCDLLSLDQFLSITHYSFAFKQGNTLVSEFDRALIALQQDGELQRLFHKWWNIDLCADEGPAGGFGGFGGFGNNISDIFPIVGPNFESDRIFITSPYDAPPTPRPTRIRERPDANHHLGHTPSTSTSAPLTTVPDRVETTTTTSPTTTTTTTTIKPKPASTTEETTTLAKTTTTTTTRPPTKSTTTSTVVYTTYRPRTSYPPWNPNTQVTYDVIIPTDARDRGYKTVHATPNSITRWPTFSPPGRGKHRYPSTTTTTTSTTPVPEQDNKNIDWFFATQEPRPPDDYIEEYEYDRDEDTYYRISLEPDETVTVADGSQLVANSNAEGARESHSYNACGRHSASLTYPMLWLFVCAHIWTRLPPMFT